MVSKSQAEAGLTESRANKEERAILGRLIEQEIHNVEKIRGTGMRYLNGIPKAEILGTIDKMDLKHARELAKKLKDVAEHRIDVERAMYDDEESDIEADACLTPPDDD